MLDQHAFEITKTVIKTALKNDPNLDLTEFTNIFEMPGFDIDGSDRAKLIDAIKKDRDYKDAIDRVIITDPTVIRDKRIHTPWYGAWLEENQDHSDIRYNWNQIKKLLKTKLSRNYDTDEVASIIKNIDSATDSILGDMENPERALFNSKGLVLGYVQSGKTANFTALIAKAIDAGYKFIVVLTGLHENLRRQTQVRLDQELTGENETDQPDSEYVSVPPLLRRWIRLTSAPKIIGKPTSKGEFKKLGRSSFYYEMSENPTKPALAIIKKNQAPMSDLIDWINDSITEELKNSIPFLLIDDEADLASINTSRDDISPTNRSIRNLTSIFSKSSYVAYTATPFANFFIDIDTPEDLYPRNFIYSLPEPEGYFGASKIFDSPVNQNYLRIINRGGRNMPPLQDDVNELLGRGEYSIPEIPETLMDAMHCFIISCAIRCLRGDENKAMSMLIHIAWQKADQEIIFNLVNKYYKQIKTEIKSTKNIPHLKNEFELIYNDLVTDSQRILHYLKGENIELKNNTIPDFIDVFDKIKELLIPQTENQSVRILLLNSDSEDELDYTSAVKPKVIAIGGNKLSRGLTIGGLMTSYYARDSLQYDTLLQMGRWFGYRQGYEDLTRVWSTRQIHSNYQHLALVEEEIRTNLSVYEEEGATPEEIPVLIRDHVRLNVTARNKLGAAGRAKSSFSGLWSQTFKMPLNNLDLLKYNINLAENFIQYLCENYSLGNQDEPNYVFRNVDANELLEKFINQFKSYDCGFPFNELSSYINRRVADGEYLKWSIGIKSLENDHGLVENWGGLKINMVKRTKKFSKLQAGEHHIGVLTDKYDKIMDLKNCDENIPRPDTEPPLLVFYRLAASTPDRSTKDGKPSGRVGLWKDVKGEMINPMGMALFTPISQKEPNSFVGQVVN